MDLNIKYKVLLALNPIIAEYGIADVNKAVTDIGRDLGLAPTKRRRRKSAEPTLDADASLPVTRVYVSDTSKGGRLYDHFKCIQRIRDLVHYGSSHGLETSKYDHVLKDRRWKKVKIEYLLAVEQELRNRLNKPAQPKKQRRG